MNAVPGYVLAVLSDACVGLFSANERVFEEMLEEWRAPVAPTT